MILQSDLASWFVRRQLVVNANNRLVAGSDPLVGIDWLLDMLDIISFPVIRVDQCHVREIGSVSCARTAISSLSRAGQFLGASRRMGSLLGPPGLIQA